MSRTIVREALKLLKERGLIDSRTGSGAYITRPEAQNLSGVMARIIRCDGIDTAAIYDARSVLECAAARRAVQRASEEQLAAMEQILQRLRDRTLSVEERRDLDFGFHYLIAQSSGNPLLALLVQAMSNIFKENIRTGIFTLGGIDDAILRHQRIMDAIKARDPEQAERAMQEHLDQSLENAKNYQHNQSR